MTLPAAFLATPLAHRGLHGPGTPENSRAAFRASIDAGYGIELDVQPARDGTPVVFHDYDFDRLTDRKGPIRARDPGELARTRLLGTDETIPTLREVVDLVAGRVPILVEIKDQSSYDPESVLPAAVNAILVEASRRHGPAYALMSFNPDHVSGLDGRVPRGLTTLPADGVPPTPAYGRRNLGRLADFDPAEACFVSHDHTDLSNPRLAELRAAGTTILCWTIRSQDEADRARRVAHNITFEGFHPA